MRLIDTHCHLAHGRLRQRTADVLDRARQAGVVGVVCAVGNLCAARAALTLSREHAGVWVTAGVHPHDAKDAGDAYLAELERLASDERNVAVGEIGLDFHYDYSPRDVQRRVFAEQLDLARRLGKPVVVHTREAFDDTMAILRESGADAARVVFHSCTEEEPDLRRAVEFGAMVSFSGIVTFRRTGYLRKAAVGVPDDRLLVETDAPFLSPEPVRKHKTNEPANVVHVAACMASVRDTSLDALAKLTTANAARFFGFSAP